jgi:hypothetical protein
VRLLELKGNNTKRERDNGQVGHLFCCSFPSPHQYGYRWGHASLMNVKNVVHSKKPSVGTKGRKEGRAKWKKAVEPSNCWLHLAISMFLCRLMGAGGGLTIELITQFWWGIKGNWIVVSFPLQLNVPPYREAWPRISKGNKLNIMLGYGSRCPTRGAREWWN